MVARTSMWWPLLCAWSLLTVHVSHALTVVKPGTASRVARTTQLSAVSKRQVAALDGAEWESLQAVLMEQSPDTPKTFSEVGYMTVVTGTTDNDSSERVVGIQAEKDAQDTVALDDSTQVYASSMATIPKGISDQDAITTLVGSLVGIHCALPKVEHVGGTKDDSFVSGKVVVVGGSDYATFAAEGLSALGASVIQVSTGNPKLKKGSKVEVMPPSVGELELGFAAVVGDFDAMLDTMSDEALRSARRIQFDDNDEILESGIVGQLKEQHNCHRYVSTFCNSQRIVRDEGVLWGPKKADNHLKNIANEIKKGNAQAIVPPNDFSQTLQTLLNEDIIWKSQVKGNVLSRGWNLPDFWELTTWPMDASASGNIRYGLPVKEDLESLIRERVEDMVSAPPSATERMTAAMEREEAAAAEAAEATSPHVLNILGVDGLQRDIVAAQRDCLLFLSAPFCRTCRKIGPLYDRMARQHADGDITFAKANATGKIGKALGRALEVEAVPTFILFREGQVYGSPLSVSRLPSKKLDQAIDDLASGAEFDYALLDE